MANALKCAWTITKCYIIFEANQQVLEYFIEGQLTLFFASVMRGKLNSSWQMCLSQTYIFLLVLQGTEASFLSLMNKCIISLFILITNYVLYLVNLLSKNNFFHEYQCYANSLSRHGKGYQFCLMLIRRSCARFVALLLHSGILDCMVVQVLYRAFLRFCLCFFYFAVLFDILSKGHVNICNTYGFQLLLPGQSQRPSLG